MFEQPGAIGAHERLREGRLRLLSTPGEEQPQPFLIGPTGVERETLSRTRRVRARSCSSGSGGSATARAASDASGIGTIDIIE